uniref:Uncharacterized protein n=1 Tax=Timema bartmani TaxID=61472 RepID=A0A7R9I5E2_9NEOP|nr:unnamed protein product [Timema bartmani]
MTISKKIIHDVRNASGIRREAFEKKKKIVVDLGQKRKTASEEMRKLEVKRRTVLQKAKEEAEVFCIFVINNIGIQAAEPLEEYNKLGHNRDVLALNIVTREHLMEQCPNQRRDEREVRNKQTQSFQGNRSRASDREESNQSLWFVNGLCLSSAFQRISQTCELASCQVCKEGQAVSAHEIGDVSASSWNALSSCCRIKLLSSVCFVKILFLLNSLLWEREGGVCASDVTGCPPPPLSIGRAVFYRASVGVVSYPAARAVPSLVLANSSVTDTRLKLLRPLAW